MWIESSFFCNVGLWVIIHDEHGDLIVATSWQLEHWDSAQVELGAILNIKSILKPWLYRMKGIIIEGDSINVIKFLQESLEEQTRCNRPPESPHLSFLS